MSMKKLLTVTLDAKQIRQACEAFVAEKMNDQKMVNMSFDAGDVVDGNVEVVVTKKRTRAARKAKPNGPSAAEVAKRGNSRVGSEPS